MPQWVENREYSTSMNYQLLCFSVKPIFHSRDYNSARNSCLCIVFGIVPADNQTSRQVSTLFPLIFAKINTWAKWTGSYALKRERPYACTCFLGAEGGQCAQIEDYSSWAGTLLEQCMCILLKTNKLECEQKCHCTAWMLSRSVGVQWLVDDRGWLAL